MKAKGEDLLGLNVIVKINGKILKGKIIDFYHLTNGKEEFVIKLEEGIENSFQEIEKEKILKILRRKKQK